MHRLILASSSPRRREILGMLGIPFSIRVSDADESSSETDPERLVELLSLRKGEAVFDSLSRDGLMTPDTVILSSDTVVSVDSEILGKPRDEADARRMLSLLSGRSHRVISGISLISPDRRILSHEVTEVEFAPLSDSDISLYVSTAHPFDKAGAYAIQGLASLWILGIRGDYFNVVGLPVHRLSALWSELFGVSILRDVE